MFCAYHGIDHPEATLFTDEHIIPHAVGGSRELSIRVCMEANNTCGREVDATLINNFFIATERIAMGIRGSGGAAPCWTFHGTIEINGQEHKSTYRISPLEKKLFVVPDVERRDVENGGQEITIECDESQLEEIIRNINAKLPRQEFNTIDLSACRVISEQQRLEHPKMQVTNNFEITSFHRAYVKMALGLAHFVLGETYTGSSDAELLREFLWEGNHVNRAEIPIDGGIWPTAEPGIEQVLAFRDWHLIGILNTGPLPFIAILFGKYPGYFKLSDTVINNPLSPGDGAIFLINPRTRELQNYGYLEYIAKKEYGEIS